MLATVSFALSTTLLKRETNQTYKLQLIKSAESYYYYADVAIGGQIVNGVFDTGSSGFIVSGVNCTVGCNTNKKYDPFKSSTFEGDTIKDIGHIPKGGFVGDGILPELYFGYGSDKTEVSGIEFKSNFSYLLNITDVPKDFSGILGWQTFTKGFAEKKVPEIFGITLSNESGEVSFGGPDRSKYTGDITYHNGASTSNYSSFLLKTKISVNGIDVPISGREVADGSLAVIDSGTAHIELPKLSVDVIHKQFGQGKWDEGMKNYVIDCTKAEQLPEVIIEFENSKYPLRANDYILKSTINGTTICNSAFKPVTDITEMVFKGRKAPKMPASIIGNIFMRKYYSVFDTRDPKNYKVGFATATSQK